MQSCGPNDREKVLQKKQAEVSRKEQQLLSWEQRLKVREQELDLAMQLLDSTRKHTDSAGAINPAVSGRWIVKMTCTETTCEGSALGDSKTEQWEISYAQNNIVVRAYSGPVLVRTYVGAYKNNILSIADEKPNSGARIRAIINLVGDEKMEGNREIAQKDCKIVYALTLEKTR